MLLWFAFVRNNSKTSRWFPSIKNVTICNCFLRYYFTRTFFFTFYESFKSVSDFGHIFAKPKDPVTKEQRTDAIYSIPYNDCDNEYIGKTKRQFGTRLKEHQKAVFLCNRKIQLYRSIYA